MGDRVFSTWTLVRSLCTTVEDSGEHLIRSFFTPGFQQSGETTRGCVLYDLERYPHFHRSY